MADGSRAILRGAKVWLRAFERSDLELYHRYVNDVEVALWAGYGTPQSRDAVDTWYDSSIKDKHGSAFYVISPLGSDEFIGTVWVWESDARIAGLELSIFIGEHARWGGGIGTDAMNAALDGAFGFGRADRVWLMTNKENARAQRAFEKAGFAREGLLRNGSRLRGKPGDVVLMAVLREDWEQLERPRSWDHPTDGSVLGGE